MLLIKDHNLSIDTIRDLQKRLKEDIDKAKKVKGENLNDYFKKLKPCE